MSERSTSLLVGDMLDALGRIARYAQGKGLQAFLSDEQCADACVRNLEIIGEAARRLPREWTSTHPEIDWRGIVGLRNRVVHEYFGVDLEMVWQIISKDLPLLKRFLETVAFNG